MVKNNATYTAIDGRCGEARVFVVETVLVLRRRDIALGVGPARGRRKPGRVIRTGRVDRVGAGHHLLTEGKAVS